MEFREDDGVDTPLGRRKRHVEAHDLHPILHQPAIVAFSDLVNTCKPPYSMTSVNKPFQGKVRRGTSFSVAEIPHIERGQVQYIHLLNFRPRMLDIEDFYPIRPSGGPAPSFHALDTASPTVA